jgi:hypothetical protein
MLTRGFDEALGLRGVIRLGLPWHRKHYTAAGRGASVVEKRQ